MAKIREVFRYADGTTMDNGTRDVAEWVRRRLSRDGEGIEEYAGRLADFLAFLAGKMEQRGVVSAEELLAELGTDRFNDASVVND